MLPDHPSASTHNRGVRSPFPAFPVILQCPHLCWRKSEHHLHSPPNLPFSLPSGAPFQALLSTEASLAAAGPPWVPLQPWTLGTGVSWVLVRGGRAMGLNGTWSSQEHCMRQEERSGICQGVSQEGKCDITQGLCHIISLFTAH